MIRQLIFKLLHGNRQAISFQINETKWNGDWVGKSRDMNNDTGYIVFDYKRAELNVYDTQFKRRESYKLYSVKALKDDSELYKTSGPSAFLGKAGGVDLLHLQYYNDLSYSYTGKVSERLGPSQFVD